MHIHELLLKHQTRKDIFKAQDQYVQIEPTEWRERDDMTVKIGLGIGTREQNLLHLESIWAKQAAMVENGGMNLTVTPRNIWNTASEVVRNANLKDPSMFFTDPGDKPAPPPSSEQQQMQQMQAELAQRQQQLDAQANQISQQRVQNDAQEAQQKHQRELLELQRKREADKDNFAVKMEEIANKLTELDLKFNANVPGSRV